MSSAPAAVSIIISTYNEQELIAGLLENLSAAGDAEIIVADGESTDGTAEIAARRARLVRTAAGRAVQMNAGARAASGDILLFLHADVRLAPGALDAVRAALRAPKIVGGNFDIRFDGGNPTARFFTAVNRWRRHFGIFYGDSGIFCRREVFERLGGYREWPILEDYDFARRLWKTGRLAFLDEPIRVSDRRWRRGGLFRTLWSWFWIQALYLAGVSPFRLARLYRVVR